MHILHQKDTHHEKGEASTKEECCIQVQPAHIRAGEVKQSAKDEEDAADQHRKSDRSVHQ